MLISLLIAVIVIGLIFYILSLMPLPQPWLNIARIILAVIVLIYLLGFLGGFPGYGPGWHNGRLP